MGVISVGTVPFVVGGGILEKEGDEARAAPPDPPASPPRTEPTTEPPSLLLPAALESFEDCLA